MSEFLYKYTAIDDDHPEYVSQIFTHNELHFSTREKFNDPFDCKSGYSWESTTEQKEDYLDKLCEGHSQAERQRLISKNLRVFDDPDLMKQIIEGTEDYISKEIGICCLSRVPDDILMWSHYAKKHEGFCIRFLDSDFFPNSLFKVSYSDIRLQIP